MPKSPIAPRRPFKETDRGGIIQNVAWLAHHTPKRNARVRLFTFPYGGGSASIFRDWSEAFSDEIEVCPVELPGRAHRVNEKPFTRMADLVEELAFFISGYADLPFAFFGHSMGALLSFELSRHLGSNSRNLLRVLASASRAPHKMSRGLARHQLPEDELIGEMRRLGTPDEVLRNPELLEYLLPVMRADFELVDTYQFQLGAQLHCPISAFGGNADSEVDPADLLLWKNHTAAEFRSSIFPGNHFYIRSALQPLANAISRDLALDSHKNLPRF